MTYITLIFKEVVFDVDSFMVEVHGVETYLAQFFACILLHMEVMNEVEQALNMLKYLNNHPERFTNTKWPLFVCIMMLSGGIFSECVNVLMLSTRHNVVHCLEHFVAFEVLTQIDNMYTHSLHDFPLRKLIKRPLKFTNYSKDIKFSSRSCS